MFRGANNINLDAKGRLAIPTRYRELLVQHCNGDMVATIDTEERCLLIYPQPEWEDLQRKVEGLHATDIQLDASGRLQLTPPLREYALLDKRTVMLGQGNKLELWSESEWISRRDSWLDENRSEELPDQLTSLSL